MPMWFVTRQVVKNTEAGGVEPWHHLFEAMGKGTGVAENWTILCSIPKGWQNHVIFTKDLETNYYTKFLVCSPWISTRFVRVPVYLSSTCTCTTLQCFHRCSSNTFFQSNKITPKLRNKSFACKLLALGFFRHWDGGGQQWIFLKSKSHHRNCLCGVSVVSSLLGKYCRSWGSDIFTSSICIMFLRLYVYIHCFLLNGKGTSWSCHCKLDTSLSLSLLAPSWCISMPRFKKFNRQFQKPCNQSTKSLTVMVNSKAFQSFGS